MDPDALGEAVTLLERPGLAMADPDGDEVDVPADARTVASQEVGFAGLVADYARRLDRGEAPAAAFRAALDGGAWEPSPDSIRTSSPSSSGARPSVSTTSGLAIP